MPKLDEIQNANQQHDPYSNPEARELIRQEVETGQNAGINAGIDQLESFANDPANSIKENIDSTKKDEENPLNYQEGESKKNSGWKANLKKYGPSGGILGGLFGLLFGAGVFLSPSLAIVHLKEVFTEDLNDQVAAMDVRSAHVFRAKLKDLGKKGICTGVKIRCGLKGMSDRQVKNFKNAGIEIETDGKVKPLNRNNNIKSLTFTSSTGEKIRITNPNEFNRLMIDRNIRNQIRRAYNPLFYSAWDKTAGKVFTKYKTGKSSRLQGDTDEERKKSVNDSVAGETQEPNADTKNKSEEDSEKEKANKDNYNKGTEESSARISSSGGFKSVFGGAAKGFGVLGSVDSACTVHNTLRLVEAGAKIIRAKQLVGFAMVFLNFADKVKAGKATEQEATFVGNSLTKIDNRQKIINETSKSASDMVNNPDYGKSGFDSEGARAAFYNDAPTLTSRSQQFMVGGGLVGTLSNVNNKIDSIIPGDQKNIRSVCSKVQNPFARIGSFIVGAVMAFGSFGATTAISIAGSIAISAALPLLEGYLKDMLAGDVVSGDTEGVDATNAIFSGGSVLLGDMAMSRGMQPANSKTMKEYQALRTETKNEYIAMGIEDAKSTPFDVMNQYSFAGMFARKLLPSFVSASSTTASLTTSLPKLLSTSFNSIIPTSSAVGDFNPDRFKKCNDSAYQEIGIDADIFCNVRYVLTPQELAMDTDEVYQWMADEGHVDGDTGEPKSEDYTEWTKECTQRTSGWGEPAEGEENGSEGGNCIDGKGDFDINTLRHFRVYTMDRSIEQGMNDGPEVAESSGTNGGGQISIASFNVRGASHDGDSGTISYETRMKRTVATIQAEKFDVIGFQEFESGKSRNQRAEFNKLLGSTYQLSSDNSGEDNGNAIAWNSSKYDLVDQGTQPGLKYTVGNTLKAPWVKLKDKETQQQFYFLNTHDPANVHDNPVTKNAARRTANAKEHVKFAKELGAKDNIPVLMTGDYNSSFKARKGDVNVTNSNIKTTLPYCIMTGDGVIKNAFDTYKKRDTKCPNKNIDWNKEDPGKGCSTQIDHLYYWEGSQPISVDSFGCVRKGDTEKTIDQGNGSDHDTVKVTITIPGSETDATGGGGTSANFGAVNFPLKGSKSVVKNPDIFKNNTTSRAGHPYIAYDILANPGTEVVAFASGKVSYVSSDRCGGKFLTIWNDEAKLGITYMHLSSHIPMNTTVKPGDHVGVVGSKEAGCGTEHLHIDASTDKIRQPCSRNGCSIEDHFRDIGKDLFTTYEALP